MHEFSIAENIVELTARAAEENQLIRIDVITVESGELRQIVPESLHMAFDSLKAENGRSELMGSCRLELVLIPQIVRCRDCDHEFTPRDLRYFCPRCGSSETEIVEGSDLVIKSIEGERPE